MKEFSKILITLNSKVPEVFQVLINFLRVIQDEQGFQG